MVFHIGKNQLCKNHGFGPPRLGGCACKKKANQIAVWCNELPLKIQACKTKVFVPLVWGGVHVSKKANQIAFWCNKLALKIQVCKTKVLGPLVWGCTCKQKTDQIAFWRITL